MAVSQWGRPDVPDFEQADLPGARSREHPPPDEKRDRFRSSCGGFSRLILSWNIRA